MKKLLIAVAALCAPLIGQAVAEEAAPSTAPHAAHLTTAATPVGDLLDNAAARAVLDTHLPGIADHPQIEMARGMTLKSLQAFSADITDEKLAAIDADLANIH